MISQFWLVAMSRLDQDFNNVIFFMTVPTLARQYWDYSYHDNILFNYQSKMNTSKFSFIKISYLLTIYRKTPKIMRLYFSKIEMNEQNTKISRRQIYFILFSIIVKRHYVSKFMSKLQVDVPLLQCHCYCSSCCNQ